MVCSPYIFKLVQEVWRTRIKKKFWIAAWSTFEEEFKDNLAKIGDLTKKGAEALLNYPPHNWCRAYFSNRCKSQMVDNNITESFNSWILHARTKPIVTMLDDIRIKVMERLKDKRE